MYTPLPASEEAFESGQQEEPITLQEMLRGHEAIKSSLAARVLAAHLYYQVTDSSTQHVDAGAAPSSDEYWTQHRVMENALMSLMVRLPPHLQLPQSSHRHEAVFTNILIHTATACLHKTAVQRTRSDSSDLACEFHRRQSRGRMRAAAAETLAVFRLAERLLAGVRNPIQDYAAYVAALVFLEDFAVEQSADSQDGLAFLLQALQTDGGHEGHEVRRMLAGQLGAELARLGIELPTPSEASLSV